MNILTEKNLLNSSFAMIRVFFDNIIRGQYSIYIYESEKINEMFTIIKDWEFPKNKVMCLELDSFLEIVSLRI